MGLPDVTLCLFTETSVSQSLEKNPNESLTAHHHDSPVQHPSSKSSGFHMALGSLVPALLPGHFEHGTKEQWVTSRGSWDEQFLTPEWCNLQTSCCITTESARIFTSVLKEKCDHLEQGQTHLPLQCTWCLQGIQKCLDFLISLFWYFMKLLTGWNMEFSLICICVPRPFVTHI